MSLQGADLESLTAIAQSFTRAADDLDHAVAALSSGLSSTQWVGNDASRFRSEWDVHGAGAVRNAAIALRTASTHLMREAREQDEASAVGTGGGSMAHSGGGSTQPTHPLTSDSATAVPLLQMSPETLAEYGALAAGLLDSDVGSILGGIGMAEHIDGVLQTAQSGDVLGAVNNTVSLGVDGLKLAPEGSVLHLMGQAGGIWQHVGEVAAQADFSPDQLQTVLDYTLSDPSGAAAGAMQGIVDGLPGILGAAL